MDKEQIEKVKKGLECCTKSMQTVNPILCDECPYKDKSVLNAFTVWKACSNVLSADALAVINELQAENTILSENNTALDEQRTDFAHKICEQDLDIKRLKEQFRWIPVSEKPMAWFNKLVSFKYQGETYFGEGHWTGAKWVVTGFPNNKFPNEIEVTHWMQPPELPKDGE